MTSIQENLIKYIGARLKGETPVMPAECDWNELFSEARLQAVQTMLYPDMDRLSEANRKLLYTQYIQNMRVSSEHTEIHELMCNAGIKYTIIKGCASGYYYQEPAERSMGDVDFLVRPEDLGRAENVLLQNGFVREKDDGDHHLAFKKGKTDFELHREVNGVPEGKKHDFIQKYLNDTVDTAVLVETEYGKLYIPDEFHHGLIMLLHMARHMTSQGMGLRHLCDWAVFVNCLEDFNAVFKDKLTEIGLWTFACQLTALSRHYLGLPNQAWCEGYSDEFLNELLEDILSAGNMGHKRDAAYDHWLISDSAGNMENKHSFFRFISEMNRRIREIYPVCNRVKALTYFFWLPFIISRLWMFLPGKKKRPDVKKMKERTAKRKKLYEQFKLFR